MNQRRFFSPFFIAPRDIRREGRHPFFLACVLFSAVALSPFLDRLQAQTPFQVGDVFAGVGGGIIKRFSPTGTLLETINTGAGSTEDTGMAFDPAGNLYATVFEANNIYKFDTTGKLLGSFGSGYNLHPESIVFDASGNAYVGQADGSGEILKFGPTGTLIDTYSPQREDRGTDWVDLAADQCTINYTSEGSILHSYNVCTKTQLPDIATGLSAPCYAHRIRPNSEELVACTSQIYRLSSAGTVVQTYHLPNTSLLFALNLDPDNKTFWTADFYTGLVFRIDIATGTVITSFNAGPVSASLAGLTIRGEIVGPMFTPPTCQLSQIVTGPPVQLIVAMQDTQSGLQNVSVVESVNASIAIPSFSPGTTSTVLTTATKLNQSLGSNVGFVVTNMSGLTTSCDPVDFRLALEGAREQHVFRGLPASEHYVRIVNGTPGVRQLTFLVNGHTFPVPDLRNGEEYFLDIGSAMLPVTSVSGAEQSSFRRGLGAENNNVVMSATGLRGSSAYVLIGDASVK